MKFLNTMFIMLVVIMFMVLIASCSGSSKSQSPMEPNLPISDMPIAVGAEDKSARTMLAAYEALIDPVAETFTIVPVERDAQYHFPLTNLYPNCLQITGFGFTPNFWADISLSHPLAGSGIDAFDPRVIAILPANPGVRFTYPTLNVIGNNRVVLEPDGYTKLWDDPAILGNVNPFIAYYKDRRYREWPDTGQTTQSKRWQMDLSGFNGPLIYKLVVDVSTNYPATSTPVTDNAPEPVQITTKVSSGLTDAGGSATLTATLLDWQGTAGVIAAVECPDLFTGVKFLPFHKPGMNSDEYAYRVTISNDKLQPAGFYPYIIAAGDQGSGINLYQEFTLEVEEAPIDSNLIWAKRAGGSSNDSGSSTTILPDNSIIVAGAFRQTATFGQGEPNQTILTADDPGDGHTDIFIARYNSNGTLAWAKRAGGGYTDVARQVATLSDDSIIVSGDFMTTATFGPGEPNETILQAASGGLPDIFIARYNTDGTLQWAKRAGGGSYDHGVGLTTLPDDSIVIVGDFQHGARFGVGEPNETLLQTAGGTDIFIAKYNPNGTLQWAKRAGGTANDNGVCVTYLSDNTTIMSGYFSLTATFGKDEPNETILQAEGLTTAYDIFIARYNANGTLAWAKRAGGSASDRGNAISTLSDNSTVLTGVFRVSATFGPGELNETILTSAGVVEDIFVARYNPNGTLAWAKRAGGESYDYAFDIVTLPDNSTVVTGGFSDTATFGPGEPNQIVITSAGITDIYVARYTADGSLLNAQFAGGSGYDLGKGVSILSDNSVVMTGFFSGTSTFGLGEPNETLLISDGGEDIVIARFDI